MKTKLLLFTVLALTIFSVYTEDTSVESGEEVVEKADDDFPGFQINNETQIEKIEEKTGYLQEEEEGEEEGEEEEENSSAVEKGNTEQKDPEEVIITDMGNGEYDSQMRRCDYAEIPLNKHVTQISASDVYNLYKVLLTSTKIEGCTDISEFDCPESGFCTTFDPKEAPEGIDLGRKACDLDVMYLYPIAESPEMVIHFIYKVVTDDALQCDETAGSGDNTPPSGQDQGEQSGGSQDQPETIQIGQTEEPEGTQPQGDGDVQPQEGEKPQPQEGENVKPEETEKSQSEETQVDPNPDVDQQHVGKAIGLAILSIIILFILIVCVYRCQFRKSGEGCFNPPTWCPGFIFPRQKASSFTPIPVDRSHELSDYEPPVPVL